MELALRCGKKLQLIQEQEAVVRSLLGKLMPSECSNSHVLPVR